jgi:hypothetical protein
MPRNWLLLLEGDMPTVSATPSGPLDPHAMYHWEIPRRYSLWARFTEIRQQRIQHVRTAPTFLGRAQYVASLLGALVLRLLAIIGALLLKFTLIVMLVFLALYGLSGLTSHTFVVVLSYVALVFLFVVAWESAGEGYLIADPKHKHQQRVFARFSLTFFIPFICYIGSSPASYFRSGFEGAHDSLLRWPLFWLDTFLNTMFYNAPHLFLGRLTGIDPVPGQGKVLLFIKTLIVYGALSLVKAAITAKPQDVFYGTVAEVRDYMQGSLEADATVRLTGQVQLFPENKRLEVSL